MTRSPVRSIATVVVLALLVVGGLWGFNWWRNYGSVDSADRYAFASAEALAEGRLPASTNAPEGTADQLRTVLEGMGELDHEVKVADVEIGDGRQRGTVTFDHRWTIHDDKDPWQYQTTMEILRHGEEWQGQWEPDVVAPELAADERLRALRVEADRGEIIGAGDTSIVTDRPVVRIGIDRSKIDDSQVATSAKRLAQLVEIDVDPYVRSAKAAGPRAFVEAIVLRKTAPELDTVLGGLDDIPGAHSMTGEMALAPTAQFARPILGSVGPATEDVVKESKGEVRPGEPVGLSGLLKSQDGRLRGTAGFDVQAVSMDTQQPRSLYKVEPTTGESVEISLDELHQRAAESALAKVKPASALVAIRPSDGHVLAAASGPGSEGVSTATTGTYAPGSTFKVVSTLALLRGGLDPSARVTCSRTTTVDGRSFKNYDDYPKKQIGRVPFTSAFANSCNTALISERKRAAGDAVPQAAEALGLTIDPALGVPSVLGDVPKPTGATEEAAAMIGQGKVVSSPLGMATVAASVAKGERVQPVLVLDPKVEVDPPAAAAKPLTDDEAEQLRTLMRAVVTKGSGSALKKVPGGPVLAKTGTAEYGDATPPKTHAWMIAIQDDLAVAVFVADGSGGARTAGPVLESYLRTVGK